MTAATPLHDVHAFTSQLPVRIAFGDGVVDRLPEIAAELRAASAAVVIEQPVLELPAVGGALAALESAGVEVARHVKPPGEPGIDDAERLGERLAGDAPDLLVAVGGGSALDLAKGARLAAEQGAPLIRFARGEEVAAPRLPLVCVPTTSGTGSEVSGGSVLKDPENGLKTGLADPLMRAQYALVDPLLTVGLPPAQTAHTGVDALAQAIGAVIVTVGNPLSVALGLEACWHAARHLPAVVADGSDLNARRGMSLASLMAGLAMNLSDCSAEHPLGEALGSLHGLPHGLTVGLVLVEALELNRPACAERLERVADALGEPPDGSGDGSRAIRAVRRLLDAVDFPRLADVGVGEDDLGELVRVASSAPDLPINPRAWDEALVERAYRDALAGSLR